MPKGIYDRSKKVAQVARTPKKRGRPAKVVVAPTISLEQAINVVAKSVSVVQGLDIKIWDDAVLFDIDGTRYTSTSYDAHRVLEAIKTLDNCKFD